MIIIIIDKKCLTYVTTQSINQSINQLSIISISDDDFLFSLVCSVFLLLRLIVISFKCLESSYELIRLHHSSHSNKNSCSAVGAS